MLQDCLEYTLANKKKLSALSFKDDDPKYTNYWMMKDDWRLMVYVFGTVMGMGKQRSPMIDIDPSLCTILNVQRYFSGSIGFIWERQRERIYDDVNTGISSTVLFADGYNIQKAKMKMGLWTIDINPINNHEFEAVVVFGHAHIMPMLPYEILGAATVIWDFAQVTGMSPKSISWFFHSLDGKTLDGVVGKSQPEYRLTEVPSMPVAKEYFLAEKSARENPFVRPVPKDPTDLPKMHYLEKLIYHYRERHNAKLTADKIRL